MPCIHLTPISTALPCWRNKCCKNNNAWRIRESMNARMHTNKRTQRVTESDRQKKSQKLRKTVEQASFSMLARKTSTLLIKPGGRLGTESAQHYDSELIGLPRSTYRYFPIKAAGVTPLLLARPKPPGVQSSKNIERHS